MEQNMKPTPNEVHHEVIRAYEDILNLLKDRAKQYPDTSRWVFVGRVINMVFQMHYRLSMNLGEEAVNKRPLEEEANGST